MWNYTVWSQDKSLSTGIFFLELLSAVEPRVVNWNLVTKGESGMSAVPYFMVRKALIYNLLVFFFLNSVFFFLLFRIEIA